MGITEEKDTWRHGIRVEFLGGPHRVCNMFEKFRLPATRPFLRSQLVSSDNVKAGSGNMNQSEAFGDITPSGFGHAAGSRSS